MYNSIPFLTAVVLTFILQTGYLSAADVEGAQDHPITGRFEGSEITGYRFRDFDTFAVHNADGIGQLEGIVTEVAYVLPEGVSIAGASRNFEKRLSLQGYEVLFSCNSKVDRKACSSNLAYGVGQLPIPQMNVDSFNFVYTLMRAPNAGSTYVALLTSANVGKTYLQASIIEIDDLEFQMVDAKQISDELTSDGHIALYGIQFDTDSATLKTESKATLAELGRYLVDNPKTNILIVGHTDNQGSLKYNMDLSTRRAGAVRKYIATEFKVAKDRMQSAGVGYLAPVATNATAEGRGLNRRVEIVPR